MVGHPGLNAASHVIRVINAGLELALTLPPLGADDLVPVKELKPGGVPSLLVRMVSSSLPREIM